MSRLPSSLHSLLVGRKTKCPMGLTHRAFGSGDVLLSHGLSPYYHRGCSVSLPCSEWERVGPLRYCHQRPEPGRAVSVLRTEKPTRISGDGVRRGGRPTISLSKEHDFKSSI